MFEGTAAPEAITAEHQAVYGALNRLIDRVAKAADNPMQLGAIRKLIEDKVVKVNPETMSRLGVNSLETDLAKRQAEQAKQLLGMLESMGKAIRGLQAGTRSGTTIDGQILAYRQYLSALLDSDLIKSAKKGVVD